jgi:hypothetical protein
VALLKFKLYSLLDIFKGPSYSIAGGPERELFGQWSELEWVKKYQNSTVSKRSSSKLIGLINFALQECVVLAAVNPAFLIQPLPRPVPL